MSHTATQTPPSVAAVGSLSDMHRQRAERRVLHRVPCCLRVPGHQSAAGLSIAGQTVNLSEGGLSIQLGQSVPQGTPVEVLLPQTTNEPICAHGMVVHSRRVATGTFEIGIWLSSETYPG